MCCTNMMRGSWFARATLAGPADAETVCIALDERCPDFNGRCCRDLFPCVTAEALHKKAAAMCPPGSPHWAAQCDAESSSRGRRYLNLHATISGHRFRKRPASTVARPQRSTRHKSRQTRRKTARTAVYQTPRGLANIGRQRGKGPCRRSFEGLWWPRRRFVPTPVGSPPMDAVGLAGRRAIEATKENRDLSRGT